MAHYEEDYEYEPERKSHFWSKFLAVLLGFILGLICTLGGLAGLGYVLFAKIKIKDGFDTVNKITGSDIDYTEYITEEYAQKTVYGLLKDLNQLASDFQNGNASLSSLEKFSPMVRKTAEKLTEQMGEYGVVVDADVFLETPLSEMSTFFKDTVNDIEIGTMLDKAGMLEETNDSYSLLMALCYGEEGEDYTFDQEGNVVMLGDAKPTTFGSLTVDTNQVLDKVSLSRRHGNRRQLRPHDSRTALRRRGRNVYIRRSDKYRGNASPFLQIRRGGEYDYRPRRASYTPTTKRRNAG